MGILLAELVAFSEFKKMAVVITVTAISRLSLHSF